MNLERGISEEVKEQKENHARIMFRYLSLGFRFLFSSAGFLRVGGSRFSRDDAALLNSVMDDDAARVYTRA